MDQNDLNDQVNLAEPQVAANVLDEPDQPGNSNEPGAITSTNDSRMTNETKNEPVSALPNETVEEESDPEEEDDTADATDADQTVRVSAPTTTQNGSNSSANTADIQVDDRSVLEKQPYDFDQCTIQIAIQLLASDGDPNGRMVVVGVRSHLDTPILRIMRFNEVGPLPPIINTLLDELKSELPSRAQAAVLRFEQKQAERAKRTTSVTATKTASRGKKNKVTTLATSPTASATVIDNRPRPEVQVTTSPQQQMGLF